MFIQRGTQDFALTRCETTTISDDPADLSERLLIERLRRGEDSAFQAFVVEHGGRMLATARRLLRSEDDAHDAVQDAFLSAFKAIGTFSGQSKLSTWLHRIVVNAALMKTRSRKRRPETSIDDLLPRFDMEGEWAPGTVMPAQPHELLEQRQTRELVRGCINQLPERYRTVLLMRDIEELSNEEIADLTDSTANAVKIRVHRARQALRTLLERAMLAGAEATASSC